MQIELLNDQGQSTSKVEAPDTVFARDYNEALVHQIVVAFQANARLGTRAQLDRADGQALDQEAVAPEGHRPRPCRHDLVAAVARRRPDLPEQPRRELHPEGQQEDVSRRHGGDPLPAGARRPPLGGRVADRRLAQDQGAGAEVQGDGCLDSVLVITHELADNLVLASRNLANVLVVEPRYADPLALVHYKKVLVTKGAMEQLKEMLS